MSFHVLVCEQNRSRTKFVAPALISSPAPVTQDESQDQVTQDLSGQPGLDDIAEIDPEEALLELPSMFANADLILKVLAMDPTEQGIESFLGDSQSKIRTRLEIHQPEFTRQSRLLGAQGHYIYPEAIEADMFKDNETARTYALEHDISLHDLIFKINLVSFLYVLVDWHDHLDDDDRITQEIDEHDDIFPRPFLTAIEDSGNDDMSDLLPSGISRCEQTLAIASGLRAQRAIRHILRDTTHSQSGDAPDPAIILRQFFYDVQSMDTERNLTVEAIEQQPLRQWNGIPRSHETTSHVKKFLGCIDALLPEEPGNEIVFESSSENPAKVPWQTQLIEKISFSRAIVDSIFWVHNRAEELTLQIRRRGGVDHIVSVFDQVRSGDTSTLPLIQSQYAAAPFSSMVSPKAVTQRAATLDDPETISATDIGARLKAFAEKGILQRSLMDTQPNGERLEFHDDVPVAGQAVGKRKRTQEDDEIVSPDNGFKKQRGDNAASQQSTVHSSDLRGSEAGPSATFPVNSGRIQDYINASQTSIHGASYLAARDAEARRNIHSHLYEDVKARGRHLVGNRKLEFNGGDEHKVQERKRWTNEETAALITYIEELGTSWALISKTDADREAFLLQGRDQVALKDKARNLKFEYMKANAALPRHFESVSLSKSMKDKLAAWNGAVAHVD